MKLKKLRIKTQIVVTTAIILGFIFLLQIVLFSVLQHENNATITSIFEAIANNTASQINSLNEEIEDRTITLAFNSEVQKNIYEYSPVEVLQNSVQLNNVLSDFLYTNKSAVNVSIIKEGRMFVYDERTDLQKELTSIIERLPEFKKMQTFFMPTFAVDGNIYFCCVTPIFPVKPDNFSSRYSQDYIICIYTLNAVNYVPSGIIDDTSLSLAITDKSNRILFSSDVQQLSKILDFTELEKENLYMTLPLSRGFWNVTVYMPSGNVSIFSRITLFFTVFIIIFTVAMLFIMLKLLNTIIVKRIEKLKKRVEKISESDTTYRIEYEHNDEFSDMITSINNVLDTVHTLNKDKLSTLDNLYKAELLQKETQILYLYGQVSPHFLYNSLVHIQGLALSHKVPAIADMAVSLSRVFRYFSNNQNLSTIKKDLDCAVEYFNIINQRRTNKINITVDVDKSLYNIPCLKMIYQPILENTLKHAYGIDDCGNVTVRSVDDEKMAIIEFVDDGRGVSSERLEEITRALKETDLINIQNGDNIGLLNVNMRLKLYYNTDCGLEISSEKGKGTTVRIVFEKGPESKEIN